jgi:hypothetical protein
MWLQNPLFSKLLDRRCQCNTIAPPARLPISLVYRTLLTIASIYTAPLWGQNEIRHTAAPRSLLESAWNQMSEEKKRSMVAAGTALLVAIAVLIPLGGFLLFRFVLDQPGLREDSEVTTVAGTRSNGSGRMKAAHVFAPAEARMSVRSVPPPPPAAPVPPAPVPAPVVRSTAPFANIPVGLEKGKLIASLGKPQMVTMELENGQPVETLHYIHHETGTETIVRLLGGKVVSAGATVY